MRYYISIFEFNIHTFFATQLRISDFFFPSAVSNMCSFTESLDLCKQPLKKNNMNQTQFIVSFHSEKWMETKEQTPATCAFALNNTALQTPLSDITKSSHLAVGKKASCPGSSSNLLIHTVLSSFLALLQVSWESTSPRSRCTSPRRSWQPRE